MGDSNTGTTHVLMIVDMSGSMHRLAADVRGGFNSYIEGLRAKAGPGQQKHTFRVTAVTFDERYLPLCIDADVAAVPALTEENYAPAGQTALLDAVGKTVRDFEQRVQLGEHDRVMCVVQTDGHENASTEWDWAAIQDLVKARTASGGQWAFAYIGAGADTWDQAQRMGYNRSMYVGTRATATGTAATYSGLTHSTVAYSVGVSAEDAASIVRDEAGE